MRLISLVNSGLFCYLKFYLTLGMSTKANLKFERLLFNGIPEDYRRPKQRPELNDKNSEVLGHFHYDFEKGTETFIPVKKSKMKDPVKILAALVILAWIVFIVVINKAI